MCINQHYCLTIRRDVSVKHHTFHEKFRPTHLYSVYSNMVCRRLSEPVNYSPQPVTLIWEPRICLDWSLSQYKVRLSQVLDSHVKAQGLPFKDKGGDESVARKGLGVILPIYMMNLICLKCHWRLPDNVSQLVLTMSWCRIGKRASSEPIVTQIYDTIWHQ